MFVNMQYYKFLINIFNVCDRKGKSALEILEARLAAVSTLDDVDFGSDDDGGGNDDDADDDVPVDANENY